MNETLEGRSGTTADTVFAILETIEDRNGAHVTEIADELDLAKSTVYRHLSTLFDREYVVKAGNEYHLGFRFLALGEQTLRRRPEYELIQEKVEYLADETGERVQFVVEDHGKGVHLFREVGENAIETDWQAGNRFYIHQSACGKAILSRLGDDRVTEIIEQHGLPVATENTIKDEDELLADLEQIRERGFALNQEENTNRLCAVGVPLMTESGTVVGSFSVAGASYRMEGSRLTEELPAIIQRAVNDVEHNSRFL